MMTRKPRERGQAMIELGLILPALLILTVGVIDVGRAFFAYNELSAVAEYAARWGSVVGGTCAVPGTSTSDWCNQINTQSGNFWSQPGNAPLQGAGTACPDHSVTADWYTVSNYTSSKATSIVGAVASHFDTSSSSTSKVLGPLSPGLDLSKLQVCIALGHGSPPNPGDPVTVSVYYPFTPAGPLLSRGTFGLNAIAQWEVE